MESVTALLPWHVPPRMAYSSSWPSHNSSSLPPGRRFSRPMCLEVAPQHSKFYNRLLRSSVLSNHGCTRITIVASSGQQSQHQSTESGSNVLRESTNAQQPRESWEAKLIEIGEILSTAFPVWVALACIAALVRPHAFLWIGGRWQIFGLTLTMLGMGMTISLNDFKGALAMPKELLAGVVLQYTVMPTAGAVVGKILGLPSHYAAGLVLVACCPGGTASNVVTYLARGNVALSVLMTSASTFLAVVMTPLLTAKLAGQYVAVDAAALFISTLQVVLLPVLTGVIMTHYIPNVIAKISPFSPLVAIVTVAALCASAVAQNAGAVLSSGGQVFVAVSTLHVAGFLFGYLLSRLLGFDRSISRTVSIEVGMQNSVLGLVLANQHFSNPLTAVPCAISSVCHSIFGSMLAAFWRLSPDTASIDPETITTKFTEGDNLEKKNVLEPKSE